MMNNFVKYCLSHGGVINPLLIESQLTDNLGICNPSIFIEGGDIRLVLRNVNYVLWNCDNEYKFTSPYGPLCYITREDDLNLRTKNFLCKLIDNGLSYRLIDMTFDKEPLWEFVGLEDARLVRWDNKLYITGVRRDTTTNGVGRMELSEIDENGKELSRLRIKSPESEDVYCEKNWMPILDKPYHYVRWCNPLQIVRVNPTDGSCEIVINKENPKDAEYLNTNGMSIRGSSQVINYNDYNIAIVHLCQLWCNEKKQKSNTNYFEQFIVWDKEWNLIKLSEPFKFVNFGIEFTNGLAIKDDNLLIPFALQDNFSFLLTINIQIVLDFIFNKNSGFGNYELNQNNSFLKFFDNPNDSYHCLELGDFYYRNGQYAAAIVLLERACEYNTFKDNDELYYTIYYCGHIMSLLPKRDTYEKALWLRMINLLPNRSEGYLMLSKYYYWRQQYEEAFTFAKLAYYKNYYAFDADILNEIDGDIQYFKTLYFTENYLSCEENLRLLLEESLINERQREEIIKFLDFIEENKNNRVRIL